MKLNMKRVFAMILALMLAIPTVAWPEEALDASGAFVIENEALDVDIAPEDAELSVEETGNLVLGELEPEAGSGGDEEAPADAPSFDASPVENRAAFD